jgi:hypothetical protein
VYPATDALAGRTRKPRGCGNARKHAVCATTDTGTKGQKGLRGGANRPYGCTFVSQSRPHMPLCLNNTRGVYHFCESGGPGSLSEINTEKEAHFTKRGGILKQERQRLG